MAQIQPTDNSQDWLADYEGQLAVDVYQTEDEVILKAPIAGVKKEDLEVSITDEVVNIKGERKFTEEISHNNYFAQECYWGAFSRSFILPVPVESQKAEASLDDHGVLTIKIPKVAKSKTKMLEIKTE